ncbi:ribonucleoside-diphosphate reductase subunit alpha [Candidatus Vampirococcus lugosii]|uniref:Ribonucleoside-diphosphate reductase n=1 Tax=Candidatus Vampirococcus lugosii TaxID=2789015 RepID=A0ABS5QL66_9BACT|nr:Ribonucleotide reductase alpha subunit [Candidatus Vampirococcus lugosii]
MKYFDIEKRNGDIVKFDQEKIKKVLNLAFDASGEEKENFDKILKSILENIEEEYEKSFPKNLLNVEEIQDIIEKKLVQNNKYYTVKSFILYREKRYQKREEKRQEYIDKFEKNKLKVIKSNGKLENFDIEKIEKVYNLVSKGFKKKCKFEDLVEVLKTHIIDGIKTKDLLNLLVKSCLNLISVDNIYRQTLAGRFLLLDIYKKSSYNRNLNIKNIYSANNYLSFFNDYVNRGRYYKKFFDYYSQEDIKKAGEHIAKYFKRDFEYTYTTVHMLNKRYLLNPNNEIFELPQEMYMSIALFLAIPEKQDKRLKIAIQIYDQISSQKISLPTPTLLNARTNFHQLSSCFKLNIEDDLRAIYHGIENMAQISKYGGGIGVYLGNIRSRGSSIRGVRGASGGVNPWIKIINDTAIAVNQLGSRAGAISVTLDIWHLDIQDFFELQTETGDSRLKAFDVFPSVSIPDLFMKRMQNNENWTLFDPKEIFDITGKKIQDHFGENFDKFYESLEKNEKITLKKTIKAKDLFKEFMKTVVETGMPYVFFRDTVNKVNPNKHKGNVYSTQLCVEICQNTNTTKFIEEKYEDGKIKIEYEPGDNVVCNLASINVAKVNTKEQIKKTIPIATKILDNVIDLNFYPTKESEITSKKYRSIGLGFLGLAELLATNKLSYDSKEARDYVDNLFELYSLETLKSSNELAKQKGTYELYKGSEWSKGILLGKDEKYFNENSKNNDEWKKLIENIKKYGVRFAYHLAPAPNSSTSQVVGTSAGVLPIYKKYFVETSSNGMLVNIAPGLNKDNFWFYKEYVNITIPDVIDMMSIIYKWIDQSISFEWIIDPAKISPAEMYQYYIKAWEKKIKTIYYVRSMSLETKECVSCSG